MKKLNSFEICNILEIFHKIFGLEEEADKTCNGREKESQFDKDEKYEKKEKNSKELKIISFNKTSYNIGVNPENSN